MFTNKKDGLTLEKLIDEINKADKGKRISNIILLQMIFFMPLIFLIISISSLILNTNDKQLLGMIGTISSVLINIIIFLLAHKFIKVRTAELSKKLTTEPDSIIWFYKIVVATFLIPLNSWFEICFIDKKTYRVDTYGYKPDEIQRVLKEVAPHAIAGFNYQILQIYKHDPVILKTMPGLESLKLSDKRE